MFIFVLLKQHFTDKILFYWPLVSETNYATAPNLTVTVRCRSMYVGTWISTMICFNTSSIQRTCERRRPLKNICKRFTRQFLPTTYVPTYLHHRPGLDTFCVTMRGEISEQCFDLTTQWATHLNATVSNNRDAEIKFEQTVLFENATFLPLWSINLLSNLRS